MKKRRATTTSSTIEGRGNAHHHNDHDDHYPVLLSAVLVEEDDNDTSGESKNPSNPKSSNHDVRPRNVWYCVGGIVAFLLAFTVAVSVAVVVIVQPTHRQRSQQGSSSPDDSSSGYSGDDDNHDDSSYDELFGQLASDLDQFDPIMNAYEQWTLHFVQFGYFLADCAGGDPPTLWLTCHHDNDDDETSSVTNNSNTSNIFILGMLAEEQPFVCEYFTSSSPDSTTTTKNTPTRTMGCQPEGPKESIYESTFLVVCAGTAAGQPLPLTVETDAMLGTDCGERLYDPVQNLFRGEISTSVTVGTVCWDDADGDRNDGDNEERMYIDQENNLCLDGKKCNSMKNS